MSWLTSIANQVGGFVGVKPFSGGPYADAGQGDLAKQAATGPLPGLNDMGALGSLPQIFGQLAKMNGLQDPMAGMSGGQGTQQQGAHRDPGMLTPSSGTGESWDPYALSPINQRQLNRETGDIATAHKTALSRVQARLSARGMGDSSSMDAAQAYFQQAYGGQAAQAQTQAGQHQFDSRQQMLTQFAQMIQQLFQDQMQRANQKAGAYNTAGQNAMTMRNSADQDLGGFLGMLTGGLGKMGGGAQSPTQADPMSPYNNW